MDRDKVIKGLEDIQKHLDTGYSFAISWKSKLIRDALELLKEQQQLIWELQKVNEHMEDKLKKVEQKKFIAHKDGTIEPIPKVVRCKDCKHGRMIRGVIWCLKYVPDELVPLNWFCADGERK